jgi:hypothetical protein
VLIHPSTNACFFLLGQFSIFFRHAIPVLESRSLASRRILRRYGCYKLADLRPLRKDPNAKRKLEARIKTLTRERDNLIAVQAHLDDPQAVAEQINDRLEQIGRLKIELDNLPGEHNPRKLAETQARMIERAGKFRELMQDRKNAPLARQVLRKALKEPLRLHSGPAGWAEGLRHRPEFFRSRPRTSGVPKGIRTPVTAV